MGDIQEKDAEMALLEVRDGQEARDPTILTSYIPRIPRLARYAVISALLVVLVLMANAWHFSLDQTLDLGQAPVYETPESSDPSTTVTPAKAAALSAPARPSTSVAIASSTSTTTSAMSSETGISQELYVPSSDEKIESHFKSRIAKVTMLYYSTVTKNSRAYEAGLLSHLEHDNRFAYKHFVARHSIVEGIWSKNAYLLSILGQELMKPVDERLEWLFWHDADVVLTNSKMQLEYLLPPNPEWSHINLMVSNDLNGLNFGNFFLRVCEWSYDLIAASLAYPIFHPETNLRYDEQTSTLLLLNETRWNNATLHMPQRFFNAYQNYGRADDIPPEWEWTNGYHEPGDILVHLPGSGESRADLIMEWVHRIRDEQPKYDVEVESTYYPKAVAKFWKDEAPLERHNQDAYWRHYNILQDVGYKMDRVRESAEKSLKQTLSAAGESADKIAEALKEEIKKQKQDKIEALRAAERQISEGTRQDDTHVS